jgi:hypothetical protein
MRSRGYNWYGIAAILFLGYAHLFGIGFGEVDEVRDIPKSVRNNPGSYRSHYSTHIHYSGGK